MLTATLRDEKIVARYRVRAQDWSRQRTLTFLRVVVLMLTGHKHALQNALNRFFRTLGLLREVPTASAYSPARQKVEPALFHHLNQLVVEKFDTLYAPEGGVQRWQGRRGIGIDGTMINLPDTAETRARYTRHGNPHGRAIRGQALGSVCYDLRNDVALEATQRKHVAQVNHAVSYLALVDHTVALLLDPPGPVEDTWATLHFLFKTNPTLQRPNRRFPCHPRSGFRRAWFYRSVVRVVA